MLTFLFVGQFWRATPKTAFPHLRVCVGATFRLHATLHRNFVRLFYVIISGDLFWKLRRLRDTLSRRLGHSPQTSGNVLPRRLRTPQTSQNPPDV